MKSNTSPTVPGCRYGRLVVLSEAEPRWLEYGGCNRRYRQWLCRCNCGRETVVRQESLRNGTTRSCGCLLRDSRAEHARKLNTKHGMWTTPEFKIWGGMLERCLRPNHQAFHRYGGRGITVCPRWEDSFAAFYADMGPRPTPEHTIDRINNDGPYSPENCRWATAAEQSRNRPGNHFLTFNGETLCLTDWARRIGIGKATLRQRIRKGWSVKRALTTPLFPPNGARKRSG